jgi:hypothetical protein
MSGNLWEFLFNLNTECMHFLEKDLENIIWESDNEKLRERGFFINGKKYPMCGIPVGLVPQ